jgi:hypothetical protein
MRRVTTKRLPTVRRGEIQDAKRCLKKWYWGWRLGLVPKALKFDALDFGTWMHAALADWYQPGLRRNGSDLKDLFWSHAQGAIYSAEQDNAPDHLIEKAEELRGLGMEMATAYQLHYAHERVNVIQAEIPLDFTMPGLDEKVIARYKFKPDLAYADRVRLVWLMEHKTAASIRTEHLVLDGQALGMGAMAERSLRKTGLLKPDQEFAGIMYNFLRKSVPDGRPMNKTGQYLNNDGSVSKKQPPPYFKRFPVKLTRKQKIIALRRLQQDVRWIVALQELVRSKDTDPAFIPKTNHHSCTKCPFFRMCVAEEAGTNIRDMRKVMFYQRDPYAYAEDNPTTDEHVSFELA